MSKGRWSFLMYLAPEKRAAIGYHEEQIDWLKERLAYHEHEREKLIHEGKRLERLDIVIGRRAGNARTA